MNKADIYTALNNFAPPELAEKWDCSGEIVNNSINNINRVMLALTVTDDVVEQALKNNCEMIISHHPLFSVPLKYKNINIFCAHTNADRTIGGTTDTLIKALNLINYVIKNENEDNDSFLRYVEFKNSISVYEFAKCLSKISPCLRYVNNTGKNEIKKIAFCAGSGSEFIEEAQINNADAFVTGDLKFHTALDSKIAVYDIGHFESERPILQVFADILKNMVEVVFAEEKSPFIYYGKQSK